MFVPLVMQEEKLDFPRQSRSNFKAKVEKISINQWAFES